MNRHCKVKAQDLTSCPNMEEGKPAGFKHDSEVLSLDDLENGGDSYKVRQ